MVVEFSSIVSGDVYALGRGDYGMLGLGSNENASEPTKLPGLKNISRVGTGSTVSYAVGENGKAYAWGMGTNLQLTTGTFRRGRDFV